MQKKLRALYKFWRLKIEYPMYYRLCALAPVDPKKIVFIENRFPKITDSFALLHEKLEREYDCRIADCFLREVDGNYKEYGRRCMAMIHAVARARCVFVNDSSNVVGCIPFRKKTDVVQVWHACGAFKKWGFSNAKGKFGANEKELLRYPYYADYSLVTVSSPEVKWAYSEAFHLPEDNEVVQATGVSRTDVFFDETFRQDAFWRLYELLPEARGKKVVLYAPTFRGNVNKAHSPRDLDQKLFREELGKEYVLVYKHHPSVKKRPPIDADCRDVIFDLTDSMTIEQLLTVSDVCITDYSSVVFEYSLFERPIFIYAFDLEKYSDWRGFYYDFESFVPGPIVKSTWELIEHIQRLEEYDIQKVKDFREKFMSACDGGATERILGAVLPDLPRRQDAMKNTDDENME